MTLVSPLLLPTFAGCEGDLSYTSEDSDTEQSSALSEFTCCDENDLPSQRVSFTPTRIKTLPRAWQRQQTTPFAARTDAQKIWKRVPLQKVTSAINAGWRKDTMKADGIMRPVKKMRAWGFNESDDKENADSVAVKWDETSPGGSPRRKAPAAAPINSTNSSKDAMPVSPSMVFDIAPDVVDPSLLERGTFVAPAAIERQQAGLGDGGALERDEEIQRQSQPLPSNTAADLLDAADVFLRVSPQPSPQRPRSTDMTLADSPNLRPQLFSLADSDDSSNKEVLLDVSALTQTPSLSTLYNDPDDTSYLQNFLLRSRAQKAARVPPLLPSNSEETALFEPVVARAEPEPDFLMTAFQLEKPQPSSDTTDDVDQEVNEEDTDAKASSPCRRSSRLTRLPRPQKPSTLLTLRRLNGGEFIALQREAQSLAVTTRANTRKNRSTAIPVQARLVQLQTEPESPEEEKHQASKKAKAVAWSEVLARFQECSGPPLSSLSSSSSLETDSKDASVTEDDVLKDHDVQAEQDKEATKEAELPKEVKKRRKERNGSVNGTPAPKRSIEILLEDAARTTGQTISLDSKRTGKRTRSRTKS